MATSRAFHVSPYKPVPARPSAGGKLMSNLSADSVGIYNYVVNRDWRRYLDRLIRSEGYDFFQASTSIPLGQQPYPAGAPNGEPVTLIHETRQPNGALAIVVGTPTTLYRFFALNNGAYYAGDGTPSAYYFDTGPNLPYYNDNPGTWIVIGTGFSPVAQRWEAEDLNGYTVFNNGVDLPVSYRVQDFQVDPLYELREAGVASVGNISVCNDLLLCGNILQFGDSGSSTTPVSSGTVTATLSGGIVTASSSFFGPASIGQIIQFLQGTSTIITGYTSPTVVTVSDTHDVINVGQTFTTQAPIPPSALSNLLSQIESSPATGVQSGNTFAPLSGTLATNGNVNCATTIFFTVQVGWTVVFSNGSQGTITHITDPNNVTIALTGLAFTSNFVVVNPANYLVVSSGPFFTAAMVGQQITFANGYQRIITAFINSTNVRVDSYLTVPGGSQVFSVTNPAAYGPYSDPNNTTRIQFRMINGVPGEPRRWSSSGLGSIVRGSPIMRLNYPMKSFSELVGQQFIILGAGVNGGNLTATLINIDAGSSVLSFDALANTTVVDAQVEAFDAVGSLVSFTDLQDDGSAIVAMKDLLGYLIVYKDTSIFLGQFSGQVGNVFNFSNNNKYAGSKSLHYRYTLIKINSGGTDFHIYAGRNSFYRFDMITQEPNEVKMAEDCKNLFFNNASIPDSIGANIVTATTYGNPASITLSTIPNTCYYYTAGVEEISLVNGTQTLTGSSHFIAQGFTVTLNGNIAQPVTGMVQITDCISTFAAESPITKDVFVCFPLCAGPDYALRFDYYNNQITSTSMQLTAACTVKRPITNAAGLSEDWLLMGLSNNTVVRYGLTDAAPIPSNAITATQNGNIVTASAPVFTADTALGRSLQWKDLSVNNVTAYISPIQVSVGSSATRATPSIFELVTQLYHRCGQPYSSVVQSGLESFGTTFGEKTIEAIVVMLSSDSPNSQLLLEVLGAINPTNTPPVLGSKLFTNVLVQNAVGMYFEQNWFSDRITILGMNNPAELIERIYNIANVNSKAFVQR